MTIPIWPAEPTALVPTPCRVQPPTGLAADAWAAIWAAEQRLTRAEAAGDRPLIVGCAKELVEAVAKAVVAARHGTPGANIDFAPLITQAHKALDRQPGEGLAADEPTRQLAQAAKSLASALAPLRNLVGTGHGKASVPPVFDETLELAVTAGLLWSRWALRRLEHLLAGALEPLLSDLNGGSTFRAGELERRLVATGVPTLADADAHRLGLAVGQRAASGTFVVFADGVRRCADSDDVTAWPSAYREGVALGLLLDRDGYLFAEPTTVATVASLLGTVPDVPAAVGRVVFALESAPLAPKLHPDVGRRTSVVSALDEAGRSLTGAAGPWAALRTRFAEPGITG